MASVLDIAKSIAVMGWKEAGVDRESVGKIEQPPTVW